MQNIKYWLLSFLVAFSACQQTAEKKAEKAIVLEGSVGKVKAVLSLYQVEHQVHGTLRYKSPINQVFTLKGQLDGQDMQLEEFQDTTLVGMIKGKFDGKSLLADKHAPNETALTVCQFKLKQEETDSSLLAEKKSPQPIKAEITTAPAKKNLPNAQIQYFTLKHSQSFLGYQGFQAKVAKNTYTLIYPNDDNLRCLEIAHIADFNQDGYEDLLVKDIVACGGNCCANSFFFCSYSAENDDFIITKAFADSWEEPVIEDYKGWLSVKLVTDNQGIGNTTMKKATVWYILEGYEVTAAERMEEEYLEAISEIKASNLNEVEKRAGKVLVIDLDNDEEPDTIKVRYWERWGSLQWDVYLSSVNVGKAVASGEGKRIGVLSSSTNEVSDLVSGLNEIYVWNGEKYELEK